MPQRRTGRTFRLCLIALAKASEGKEVLYITKHNESARHSFKMAGLITQAAITPDSYEFIKSGKIIKFKGAGRLQFVSEDDKRILDGGCDNFIYDKD